MNLAVFSGQYFWHDGECYSTDEAFVKFVTSFESHFDRIYFVDAVRPETSRKQYVLDPTFSGVVKLPNLNLCSFRQNVLAALPQIYRQIEEHLHQWDVVWLHNPHPIGFLLAHICRKARKPHFQIIRQNLPTYAAHRNRGLMKVLAFGVALFLDYWCLRLSKDTLTFTVGREMYERYKRNGGPVYPASVCLVSESDIMNEAAAVHSSHRKGDRTRLLSVGRLDPEKGLEYLIEAVGEIVGKGQQQVLLEIVGEGSEETNLRSLVQEKGLKRHIRFLGYVPHGPRLFDLYRRSDVYVLPSLTEGWPQTLYEAMACGVPVVAAAVGGIPSAIENGKNGLLIHPKSPREIRKAIERLEIDAALKKKLVLNGRATVAPHTMEREREKIFQILQPYLRQV
jgi:glycosyltransferase involved in cell wall biosynthesis